MEQLGERLAECAAHLDAAMHRFLSDLRRFDEGGGWAQQAAQSCAHWLSWRLGMDRGTAREHLRVAHRLSELPLLDDALRRGAISYSKVRAITRVAGPATEPVLVGMAEMMTASQLELACRKLRTTQRKPPNPDDLSELRYITRRDLDDGMTLVSVRLRPDEAARLFSVLDAVAADRTRERPEHIVPVGTPERTGEASDAAVPAGTLCSDAAEPEWTPDASEYAAGLAGTPGCTAAERTVEASEHTGVSAGTSGAMSGETRKLRGHRFDRCDALMELVERQARGDQVDRASIELVVTVSAAALTEDPAADPLDRAGVTADGTCLTIATVQRLACDAGVVVLAEDDHGTPLAVGRKHRTVTTALKRALAQRDPHCQFPGCTNSVFMEAHHIEHWIDGGKTKISNLVNLCGLCRARHKLHYAGCAVMPGRPAASTVMRSLYPA